MKLLLIDGHYYVYRSFFAIPNLSNSKGEPTNAIFGFTKTLRLMVKHLQPELGAVFWDEGMPERRVKLQPAYKETRKEMPKPMVPQLDLIQELTTLRGLRKMGGSAKPYRRCPRVGRRFSRQHPWSRIGSQNRRRVNS